MSNISRLSWALLAALNASSQDTGEQRESVPPPRDVTAKTLKNPDALRALQKPGKVIFEDDFESEESLARYFEIRGREQGKARLETDEAIAHRGLGAMRFEAPAAEGASSGSGVSDVVVGGSH